MSSSTPNAPINPYAPPKATPNSANTTTYLDQDGYTFQNELIANHHFKSPLICAKLGIPIPPETNPQPTLVTVTRTSKVPNFIINLVSLSSFILIIYYCSHLDPSYITPAIIAYIILARIIKRLATKPYKIPFYFSERYLSIRRNRIITFSAIALILPTIFTTGIITANPEYIGSSILAAIITFITFKFKMTKFIVTNTKGEFHYIRGIHQNLLDALPHLPLSS